MFTQEKAQHERALEKVEELNSLNKRIRYYYQSDDGHMLDYPQAPEDANYVSTSLLSTDYYSADLVCEANIEAVAGISGVIVIGIWGHKTAFLPIESEGDYQNTLGILKSLDCYPCLNDEIWARLETEQTASEWQEWGKNAFVEGMAKKYAPGLGVAEILDDTLLWTMYCDLTYCETDAIDINLAVNNSTIEDWNNLKPCLDLY